MNSGLFKKYFFTAICLMLVFTLFLALGFSISAGNFLTRDKEKLLDKNCRIAADFYRDNTSGEALDFPAFYGMLRISSASGDCDMFACDSTGAVLCCSCEDWRQTGYCTHSASAIQSSVLKKAQNADGYFEVGTLGGVFKQSSYTAARALTGADGSPAGTVFASLPAADLRELYLSFFRMFVLAAILPLCLIFGIAYAASMNLARPLKMMSGAARAMAKGDFSRRIPVRGNDEIAELASAFNEMTDALSRLESMRRSFVANVSHELKTPMTTIGGFIDGILDGTIPKSRQDEYLRIVSVEVKRLSRVVQSMLNLSRLESGEQKPNFVQADLSETVISAALSFEQKIEEKSLEIRGLDTMEPVTARIDRDLIHQAVYNLIDNAVKFANEGGYLEFSLHERGNQAVFRLRNSGKGISEKDLPHIFERFYKSDFSRSKVKDSTGLGLYIVKSIVNIHGGKITVRSREDSYTEFEMEIPISEPGALPQ